MIAEAVDAAATAALYVLVVGAAVAWLAVTRGIAATLAAAQGSPAPKLLPERHKPPHARTAPSWAQPDKDAA